MECKIKTEVFIFIPEVQPILCKDSAKIRPRPDYEGFVLDYAEGEEPQEGKVSAVQRHKETAAATDAMYKAQMKAHEEKVRAQEEAKERLKAEREAREQALRTEAGQQPTKKGGGVKFSLGEDEITEESKVLDDASEEELSTSKAKFSIVEDPEEIERLEKGPKVTRYRAMVEIDGKLYPPMSVKVDGKLREPTEPGVWERSDETPFEFTEEQKAAMAALDAKKGKGSVEIVPGKVRYIKDSETGTGTLKFRLKKDNGDDIWAAYNPYFHTSTSGMNDQFSSAWKRPNLVVVEVEVPESELSDGYQAPYAKDAVGDTPWKSGTVNNALPADRQRTVTLSRWAKVKGKVDDSEVARMIAQQLDGLDIEVPFNVVTPSLREELVKLGVRIGPPEKGNAGKSAIPAYEEWVKSQGKKSGQVKFAFAKTNEEFDEVHSRVIKEKGIVMPGLNEKNVTVVKVERMEDGKLHPFDLSLPETKKKRTIEKYAVEHGLTGDVNVEGGVVYVSKSSIGQLADRGHIRKSVLNGVSADIYVSALLKIKDIIKNSVDTEIYPDLIVKKEDGKRDISVVSPTSLMHIMYGAVNIDNKNYRVKLFVVEQKGSNKNNPHFYELKEIALSDGHHEVVESDPTRLSDNTIPITKLLKGIKRAKYPDKFLLEESAKLDEQNNNGEIQNNQPDQENGDNASDSVGLNFGTGADRERVNLPDVKKYVQSIKVPERFTSQAQAAMWTYQVLGRVRGALNKWYGDVGSKDFRMGILSTDSDQGREIDLRNALYGSARVNEYLDFVQPKLYEARDNSTSEEARRYFEELIDDCNYARQWYDRAAKGDTTVLDDAPPRFDIDPDVEETEDYDAGRMTLDEMISKGLTELAQKNSDNVSHRVEAMRSIGGNLQKLRQAMALQREYDRGTVDSIVRLARLMMGSGLYTGFSPYEVSRLMGMVNRAAGREDITKEAEKVVDMMVDHQLKELERMLSKNLRVKGSKLNSSGVEVQAGLDIEGQRMMTALKESMDMSDESFAEYASAVQDRMSSDDEVTAANATQEWQGVTPPSATTRRSSRAMAPSPARCSLTGRWRRPS